MTHSDITQTQCRCGRRKPGGTQDRVSDTAEHRLFQAVTVAWGVQERTPEIQ